MVNKQNGNGNGAGKTNGNGNGKTNSLGLALATDRSTKVRVGASDAGQITRTEVFDQPVVLQQTNLWSRAIVWGIVGVTSFMLIWASFAKIDEAVPAPGQLKPQGSVQPVQAPVGGVVEEILVKDGQRVKRGDVLIRMDTTAAEAERRSSQQILASLERQNQFYRSQLGGVNAPAVGVNVPPEILALATNRAALIDETRLYEAQLGGDSTASGLSAAQRVRIQAGLRESDTRSSAAQFEVAQLQQQLSQAKSQLVAAQKNLTIDESIYGRLKELSIQGGIGTLQVDRQEQQLLESRNEVDRLVQEMARLEYAIAGANEKMQNTMAVTDTDVLGKIAENQKQLASIDTQLNKAIVDNDAQIAELKNKLSQTSVTLKYQELRAPVDGVVFDMKAKGTGFVATTSEPIVQIVPGDGLVAEVYVTNADVGFVRQGMIVDVRVDSFPFSEFGDIKGEVLQIGSDALPPDPEHNFYRFPIKIRLDKQYIETAGQQIPIQSGMSVSANIKIRKRTVMTIVTDQFTRKVDSFQNVR
ncbi:MAG: HlyD family efflux transporter periplasmic adaptor subunit [Timaviella obliquedivisa GSE-PSE-MK23-08B]|jgi:HlyD family secretion protein|nr:HlyD family efflux transporter periplasmic adaptor subunit [Timaviella obliquedivisa GSE-PSE-MK23-08B]